MENIKKTQSKRELVRVGRTLNEIILIKDATWNLLHKIVKPVMIEFYPRDIIQIVVWATLLAVPMAFSAEVWDLGELVTLHNTYIILALSLVFMWLFFYYNFYRNHFRSYWLSFIKRVIVTYAITFLICFLFLYLVDKANFGDLVSFKRTVLVALPASMSASVADMIK